MIKNMRIPRYKTIFPDSEISDGTTPVYADSEARPERFLQKRNFISGRADKNLYFPSLTFGRGHSDASRRFVTWGIEIYNQIKGLSILKVKNRIELQIFPILTFGREHSDASRRFVTWGIEIYNQIKGLSILKVKHCIALHIFPILTFGREDSNASRRFVTRGIEIYNQIIMNTFHVSRNLMMIQEPAGHDTSHNLAFPGGGIRRPHPRLIIWGRGCGNGWSLGAIRRRDSGNCC